MEKISKVEKKFINWIENHIDCLIIIGIVLFSLILRYFMLSYQSEDFKNFLSPWFYELKEAGGLSGLANYPGDYNAPYMTILALLTYLKINPLISIKIISIIFDYILAFLVGKFVYDIRSKDNNRKMLSILAFGITLFLPTVVMNGALWAQCDVIYTTFLVLAFYFLYKDKTLFSFISLGLAFAFKLQFIFVLPVYIILYFRKKNFSILYFLIIPLVNFILCLPVIIAGKPISECLLVYFNQTSTYKSLNLNFPNLYSLINGNEQYLSKIGILTLIIIFAFLLFYIIKKKVNFNMEKILLLGVLSIVLCTYFLPYMHERYLFAADIFSLLYCVLYKRNYLVAILISFISIASYCMFLFNSYLVPSYLISMIFFGVVIFLFKDFIVMTKNEK